ncbi:MAG: response regulator [Defluviitaleaceae bacterium]|nr:response regulator [Defluviitaleaceae bacterium]
MSPKNDFILEAAPIAVVLLDKHMNPVDCNEKCISMFGYTNKAEYLDFGYTSYPPIQPDGRDSAEVIKHYFAKALAEGYSFISEFVCQKKDGTFISIETNYTRTKYNDDYVIVEYTRDITHRLLTKEREREAREKLQQILDSAPFIINQWDENNTLLKSSKQALEWFKVSSEAEYIKNFYSFAPEYQPCGTPSSEKARAFMDEAKKKGSTGFEWIGRATDGEIIPMYVNLVCSTFKGKGVQYAFVSDLRPVKALESKLREQEISERVKLMTESTPLMIEFWNENCEAIDCNKATLDFFNMSDKEAYIEFMRLESLRTRNPDRVTYRDVWDDNLRKIFAASLGKFEACEPDLDGNLFYMEVDGILTKLDDRDVVITYARDVTQIRESEQVKIRAEIAEESNRAKSRFLAQMSHEIRTPITAVLGISEIELQNPGLPPHLEESFERIHNSADTLLGIVNDVLDLSKIEAGKMELYQANYGIAGMIRNIALLHTAHLNGKDIKFRLSVDENLPTRLLGDNLRIEQVVSNLLSNAFKYTEVGSVELAWKYFEGCLVISLSDTGFGMTQEQIGILLSNNEFTRFHEHENKVVSGTGLGMSIVCNLLHLMNARMSIESEVGKGTTVVVHIPQKEKAEAIGKAYAQRLENFEDFKSKKIRKSSFVPESMPYGKVLIVDDVEANIYVAKGLLAFYDLNIETCFSGFDAIEKIKQGATYDLIFMDYMMPEMNGIEAMQEIRKMGYASPIVALTANALIGQEEEFIISGFDGFISKPIQTKHLNTVLHRFIRDKQSPETLEAASLLGNKKGEIDSFQDNLELQKKLKANFRQKQKHTMENIRKSINGNDIDNARLLAHSLKGVSGLIFEHSLSDAAGIVEHLLESGKIPSDAQLSALEDELTGVLASIETHASDENLVKIFDELEPLLKSQNVESIKFADRLGMIPETFILCRQIEEFDYVAALKSLDILKQFL